MKHAPNILTMLRMALSLFVFVALATVAGAVPWDAGTAGPALYRWAFAAFVVASVTDFFDGWLARRYHAVSVIGRILDPIADKVLVCAVVLGFLTLSRGPLVVIPLGLILFREFAVSALREVAAGRSIALPVTRLAKWKTTLQLTAFGALIVVHGWAVFGLGPAAPWQADVGAIALLAIATIVTLITGFQYGAQAARALAADSA